MDTKINKHSKEAPLCANFEHGGNLRLLAQAAGRGDGDLVDFSASINPLGPPEYLRALVSRTLEQIVHYPDPDATELVDAIASAYDVDSRQVIVGNGSTELIHLIPRAFSVRKVLIPAPAYGDYAKAAKLAGKEVEYLLPNSDNELKISLEDLSQRSMENDLVFMGRPVNPTGFLFDADQFVALASSKPQTLFAIDESFFDFIEGSHSIVSKCLDNVLSIRSMTKFFALPGLRLGFAVAPEPLAEKIRGLQPSWTVNSLAQCVGAAVVLDKEYAQRTRDEVAKLRESMRQDLLRIPGIFVYPSAVNYLLIRIDRTDIDAPRIAHELLQRGLAIRRCDNFVGLDGRFFRVAVRTARENALLSSSLAEILGGHAPSYHPKRRTPAIMFQGTSSGAGKSVLTAALCRILLQDGFRVAPFKAQNMSLNSFVTAKGEEMGRAQVVQAQACRIEPDARMNPVLLKPNSVTGSQVIVNGKVVRSMEVSEYIRFKRDVVTEVEKAYDSLASEHDVIVLEGAGSPAEVNLKAHDIVNMRMAKHAGSPVLLVGDIDRGGVFASFVGTLEVLAEWERNLIAGFVVNRFRGKAELLSDAFEYMIKHTGRHVLGVIPYIRDLGLPEEDSVAFKSGDFDAAGPSDACIDIALIDLPHISNFTDFDPLRLEPDLQLRIVRSSNELGSPDAILVPGSKNTAGDLAFLRSAGLDKCIRERATDGRTEIIGICAGMQMLGLSIRDPHGLETTATETTGLGLIPIATELALEKTLTRTSAIHLPSGLQLKGYEIHHGFSDGVQTQIAMKRSDGAAIGFQNVDGMVWGTYLHGLFDNDEFRRHILDRMRSRKGLSPLNGTRRCYDLETEFDLLADTVRRSLDMKKIYRLIGLP